MTAIHQNALANHQSIDDTSHHSENKSIGTDAHGRQILDDSAHDSTSGIVNISFHAHMRLRAYQDQKSQLTADVELAPVKSLAVPDTVSELSSDVIDNAPDKSSTLLKGSDVAGFSEQMTNILSEVENNIVQTSEPGYRYLLNMLNNYKTTIEDPQQLQEIMRKEEFYLSRRKPFMESADFQSYSQVLGQFSNIIERQQYSS
ncbi:MAG: hypothetical protein DRQ43_02205 [Gammaproteobacteria bacterium]|nr:MAG: hypothetical protein DRQ43_02205 [Gammaproteobacteria bacterium]